MRSPACKPASRGGGVREHVDNARGRPCAEFLQLHALRVVAADGHDLNAELRPPHDAAGKQLLDDRRERRRVERVSVADDGGDAALAVEDDRVLFLPRRPSTAPSRACRRVGEIMSMIDPGAGATC